MRNLLEVLGKKQRPVDFDQELLIAERRVDKHITKDNEIYCQIVDLATPILEMIELNESEVELTDLSKKVMKVKKVLNKTKLLEKSILGALNQEIKSLNRSVNNVGLTMDPYLGYVSLQVLEDDHALLVSQYHRLLTRIVNLVQKAMPYN
jgi:hypothetical protein